MLESEGRTLHRQAEDAREKRRDFSEALRLTDQALLAYQAAGDTLGMSEVLSSRSIVFRHLYQKTNDLGFLEIAKDTQRSAVTIARKSGIATALALPLRELAKVQESLGELSDAVVTYRAAVNSPLPEQHDRDSVRADFRVHLATAEYKAGDKTALARAEEALNDLENAEEQKYEKDVWVSGGYMRIADMLRTDDPAKAAQALQKAKDIIDANPKLELRKGQWEKLAATFSSN